MGISSGEGRALAVLLAKGQYAKAHAWLNRQDRVQLEGEDAKNCLTAALHASPNLFRKVLSRCAPGEYSGDIRLQLTENVTALVCGTLLTLAAAMNRPDHVRSLLDAGYDPNSAGVESAAAFGRISLYRSSNAAPYGDRCAVGESRIQFCGKAQWDIPHATPLAAAVACGSREAAAVLLRCTEVWKAESGVVCRAAVSALQMFPDDPRQELAGMVFGKTRGKVFDPKDFVHTCDLQIEYSADFCTRELLKTQIECGFCDEAGARTALKTFEAYALFARRTIRARMWKLELMAKYYPDLCRESWVAGLFLRELVRRYTPQTPHVQLMKRWKQLCGEEGDLTWARQELYRMPREHLQSLLKDLSRDVRLLMDADSFAAFGKEAKGELMDLLTHVQLRHNRGLDGVSALATALVRQTDLRYLRKAARLGAFSGEDPQALLEYLEETRRSNLRSLVLAYAGQGEPDTEPRWKQECRGEHWTRHWSMGDAAYEDWLQQLMDEELPEEECLRRLQVMNDAEPAVNFWRMDCHITVKLTDHPRRKVLQASGPEAALSCGTQTAPLRMMLRYMPEKLEKRYRVEFCDRGLLDLEGTPLALAAATGRTELVRFLLDAGFDPDETGQGIVSSLQWFNNPSVPVTPVMAAIYYGEEETAKLLLEAGAKCDFSKPMCRKLLERGNEQTLELAEKLPGVNFESLRPEWLESLREKDCF